MSLDETATSSTHSDEKSMDIESTSQKVTNQKYSCDICNLSFNNNCILDAHLAGKRHQKAIRTRSLDGVAKDPCNTAERITADKFLEKYYCQDCGIFANSSNQLDMHMQSNKHIIKVEKNKAEAKEMPDSQTGLKKKVNVEDVKDVPPTKKVKVPEVFKCTMCNVEMNSQIQFDQHLESNKHKNRQNPQTAPKSKFSSVKRKGAAYMAKKREARFGLGYERPLYKSFVSGGSYLNNSQTPNTTSYSGASSLFTSRNETMLKTQSILKTRQFNYNNSLNTNYGENFQSGQGNPYVYGQGNYMNKKPLYGRINNSQNYAMNQPVFPQFNYMQNNNNQQPPPPPPSTKPPFSLW